MKTIIGNWKMNVGIRGSVALARGVLLSLRGKKTIPEVVICPPFVALSDIRKIVARSHVQLGAQNMSWEEQGAFTGEISSRMLEEAGVSTVILGHSERRALGETNEMVNKKVARALQDGLTPIVCVGESAEQRDAGESLDVVRTQVLAALSGIELRSRGRILLAYEPVWAVKSTETDSIGDILQMLDAMREVIELQFGDKMEQFAFLYGGSVNAENAYSILRESGIDGVLVGSASVKLSQFQSILGAAMDVMEGLSESKTT